jgi:hypothetical protein
MKNLLIILCVATGLFSCKGNQDKKKIDKPQEEKVMEVTQEWTPLFDGETFNGWHQYNGEGMSDQWSIVDNSMVFTPKENRNYGDGGKNIVTDKEYTNFVLSMEWNVSEVGNSGIFWGVKESEEFGEPYLTGPEIQVLDNERHPDAKANPKFHQAGALV